MSDGYPKQNKIEIEVKMVEVWTTGKCNLNCAYCFAVKKLPLDMTEEIAETTTNYLQEIPGKIDFYGGEALQNLHPIKRMLGTQNKKIGDRSFGITTNGVMLKDDALDWLRYHDVNIALSFDGSKKSQDMNRSGTYETVVENAQNAMKLGLDVGVLKVMYPIDTMFEDVLKIKELGFKSIYLNILKPYGFSYEPEDIPVLEEQYQKIVRTLHRPPDFKINDYENFSRMSKQPPDHGCGIGRQGKTIGPDGYIYPCIDGPLLGQEYAIGSVWHGVDPVRERKIKQEAGKLSKKCQKCHLSCTPCNITSFLHNGEFGVEPSETYCESMKAKYRAVEKAYPKPTATPNLLPKPQPD